MSSSIPYSAEQDDLFYPCKRGEFFPAGRPESEAALCAEMARLAYCKQESSFAFDQDKIRSILRGIGFTVANFSRAKQIQKGRVSIASWPLAMTSGWPLSRNVLLRGLADHAPINYVWPLEADRSQLPSSLQATTGGG